MTTAAKLTGEQRRAAIIQAVRHLFASKGFKGTTTRELAEAAGVSEALLYRHFPTKEDLYAAIQQSYCDEQGRERFERLSVLEPSTQTLVLLVHFLVSQILGTDRERGEQVVRRRMMLRSLAEDCELVRVLIQPVGQVLVPKIEECLRAAASAGDAAEGPLKLDLGAWLAYSLPVMVSIQLVQSPPLVDYGVERGQLVGQIVWFVLRGLGLREEAIQRHYKPETLRTLGV
jgi:AcrR family transcriptional regulator